MMFQFFKKSTVPQKGQEYYRTLTLDGLLILKERVGLDAWAYKSAKHLDTDAVTALIEQLEEEGLALTQEAGVSISWEQLYSLLENPAYFSSLPILDLPPIATIAPILKSQNSLADSDFAITISGWVDQNGRDLGALPLTGAAVKLEDGFALLDKSAWELLQEIAAFHRRADKDKTDIYHRRAWGRIRQKALPANSRLDDFLFRSVVLTPEKLDIDLRRADIGGTKVVEVAPVFGGAPSNWLDVFDKQKGVPDRYDIPTAEGVIQILITPPVKSVLEQIKRFEKRRMAGSRAEAFVINPFAALGEDASDVIDPVQFEKAREKSGLLFDRFTSCIQLDAVGYPEKIGLAIELASSEGATESGIHFFEDDRQLEQFIQSVERNLDKNLQLCGWNGYEFELLGDTLGELGKLKKALEQQRQPRVLVSYAHVYDLSRYSSRVEDIGLEKIYYSPFIAKKKDEGGWFPENLIPVISYTPEGDSEPVAIPITAQAREQLEAKLAEAKAAGENEFSLNGFPKPITVKEADAILQTFSEVLAEARDGKFDPTKPKNDKSGVMRKALVIKANIQSIDYEEARRDVLNAFPEEPELPSSFRPGVTLMEHQKTGIARIQHLLKKSPEHCRGVVMADDMGLGKTIQLLTVIARAFEKDPNLEPALVVAPVSLLENWEEETKKFLALRGFHTEVCSFISLFLSLSFIFFLRRIG